MSRFSLGGMVTKNGNSEEFKTGDWKNKYPYHDKEKRMHYDYRKIIMYVLKYALSMQLK